ncbi:hypothetical protein OROGR_019760 [Orobanche gracilis]
MLAHHQKRTNQEFILPQDLRGELLKLKSQVELSDESSPVNSFMRNTHGAVSGPNKSDSLKPPRFTWMDEHFRVTKISRLISIKETSKDMVPSKCVLSLNNSSLSMDLNAKHEVQNSCLTAEVHEKVKQIQAEVDEQVDRKVQLNLALVLKNPAKQTRTL